MLENIHIVLVETTHPGNIGAAARAMKNMCLGSLRLVNPRRFPDTDAITRASGADDILEQTQCFDSLHEAIADCAIVMGASARLRSLEWPQLNPRQAGQTIVEQAHNSPIALVMGRESSGLTNEELQLCHYLVHIPGNPEFNSLNVAAAVQVFCYEIYQSYLEKQDHIDVVESMDELDQPVSHEDMQRFYQHLQEVMIQVEFLNPDHPKKLMARLQRLFNRAQPDQREMNILRGMLTAIARQSRP